MFNNIEDAKQAITGFQVSHQALMSGQAQAKKTFATNAHDAAYTGIGEAFGVAIALKERPEILAGVLLDAGIKVAGDGENPFSPIVKLLYRQPVKGGGTKADKSAWKYGPVMRYCFDQKWEPEDVPANLKKLELEIDGVTRRKLLAAELADRDKYKDGEQDRQFTELAFVHMLDQPGIATMPGDAIDVEGRVHGSWVSVAAVWDSGAQTWIIHQPISTNSDTVKKSISKAVTKSFKDHNDALFIELAVHNEEMDKLNARSATAQFLNVRRETERASKLNVPDASTEGVEQHEALPDVKPDEPAQQVAA